MSKLLAAAIALALPMSALALSNSFSYQGSLNDAGSPASGSYDLQFQLQTGAGANVGAPLVREDVAVAGGLFSVELDFGAAITSGDFRLQIGVRPGASAGAFTTLAPTTSIRPTPQAQVAGIASEAVTVSPNAITGASIADGSVGTSDIQDGSITGTDISNGSIASVDIADSTIASADIADGSVSGLDLAADAVNSLKIVDGSVSSFDVNPALVQVRVAANCAAGSSIRSIAVDGTVTCENDDDATSAWRITGNPGTNSDFNFIGTTDAKNLEFRVANVPALVITPFTGPQPAIAMSGNVLSSLATAGVVLGGGSLAAAQHTLTGEYASITGGYSITASGARSHVGGGEENSATGYASVIAGGGNNAANRSYSTVAGGQNNLATGPSDSFEAWSAVGGGFGNAATGASSTIAGGSLNDASGEFSSAPGGRLNCAGGDSSLTAGFRAVTRAGNEAADAQCFQVAGSGDANGDEGTFVWADSQNVNFVSSGPDQFLIRAQGGVGINGTPAVSGLELNVFGTTPFDGFVEFGLIPKPSLNGNTGERVEFGVGKGGAGSNDADLRIANRNDSGAFFEHLSLDGDGSVIVRSNPANPTQGVQLAIGAGAWSTLSDRNLKTDIQSILPLDVLERLVAIPIQQWRYIGQPGQVQHIGPMAQDFAAAFGVGENETTISTVDADGVALAAIQGLNQKLESENASLRAELAELRALIEARIAAPH